MNKNKRYLLLKSLTLSIVFIGQLGYAATYEVDPATNEHTTTSQAALESSQERASAIDRFSLGLATSQTGLEYKIKRRYGEMNKETGGLEEGLLSYGIIGRYSQVPSQGFGFDWNASYLTSPRMLRWGNSEFHQFRAEGNLVYAFDFYHNTVVLSTIGLNAELLNGEYVRDHLQPLGYGFQLGAGLKMGSKLFFDLVFSMSAHKLSDGYRDKLTADGSELDEPATFVFHRGYIMRMNYNF